LKVYRKYLANHKGAMKRYWQCCKNEKQFGAYIEQTHIRLKAMRIQATLDEMLTKPTQRIPLYKNFLDICKEKCSNCGKCKICEGYKKVNAIAEMLSKSTSLLGYDDQATYKQLVALQDKISGDVNICAANRHLIMEENLQFTKNDKKKKHYRRFWLFNDAMLITKDKKDQHWLIRFLPIDHVTVSDPDPSTQRTGAFTVEMFGFSYSIVNMDLTVKENWLFQVEEVKKMARAGFTIAPPTLQGIALTRETAVKEIEDLQLFTSGPRMLLKVIERFDDQTKEYLSNLGDHEVGNQYEVGKDGAIIGRELEETDLSTRIIISSDESISRRNEGREGHAEIVLKDGKFQIHDLGSSGGTYIVNKTSDYKKLGSKDFAPLVEGTVFQLGRTRIQVKLIDYSAKEVSRSSYDNKVTERTPSHDELPARVRKGLVEDIPTGSFSPEFVAQMKKTFAQENPLKNTQEVQLPDVPPPLREG